MRRKATTRQWALRIFIFRANGHYVFISAPNGQPRANGHYVLFSAPMGTTRRRATTRQWALCIYFRANGHHAPTGNHAPMGTMYFSPRQWAPRADGQPRANGHYVFLFPRQWALCFFRIFFLFPQVFPPWFITQITLDDLYFLRGTHATYAQSRLSVTRSVSSLAGPSRPWLAQCTS